MPVLCLYQIGYPSGKELYNRLDTYLKGYLEELECGAKLQADEALLTFYTREWNRFTAAAKHINHLFRYLNRHWVKREMGQGKKNIYDVYTLHLVRWKQDFFMHVKESVMASVLVLVEKQRNGETVDTSQIKSVVDSFVSLGFDENGSTKSTLEVYRAYFEKPFLRATAAYYRAKSEQTITVNSVAEYMKKVSYDSTLPDNKPY